jgi:plastocyanin
MRIMAVVAAAAAVVVLGLSGPAHAADPAEVKLTIENNRFSPEELKVKANAPFVITVTNKDKTAEEFESKELKIEKVIPPGQTVKVRVRALKPGTYNFIGDYHHDTAKGRIVAE